MAELLHCKVVGSFKGFVADENDDPDDLPQFNVPTGSGVITPNVKMVKYNDGIEKFMFYPSPYKVILDASGNLSQGGRPYINLLSPTPEMQPNFFQYSIVMTLKFDGNSRTETWGPFYFTPTAGTTQNLFDMISATPAPAPEPTGGTTYMEDPNNPGYFIEA